MVIPEALGQLRQDEDVGSEPVGRAGHVVARRRARSGTIPSRCFPRSAPCAVEPTAEPLLVCRSGSVDVPGGCCVVGDPLSLWTHSIHISYYTSYLVPLGLIALVLVPDSPLATSDTPRRHVALTTELATIGVLVAAHLLVFRWGNLFWAASSSALAVSFPAAPPFNTITAFAICGAALSLNRFARSRWLAWPAFLLTLWIAYSSVPMNWGTGRYAAPERGLRAHRIDPQISLGPSGQQQASLNVVRPPSRRATALQKHCEHVSVGVDVRERGPAIIERA